MTRFLERLARRALQVPPQVRVAAEPAMPAEGPWVEPLAPEVSGMQPAAAAAAPGREAVPHALRPPATPPEPPEPFQPLVHPAPVPGPGLADAPLPVPRGPVRLAAAEAPDAAGPAAPRADPGEPPAPATAAPHAAATTVSVVPAPATPRRSLEAPVSAPRRGGAVADAADAATAAAPLPAQLIRHAAAAADLPAAPELEDPAPGPGLPVAPGRPARPQAPERPRTHAAQPARAARDTRDTRLAQEAATTVHVTIGRIEIAAVAPPPAPQRAPAPGARPLSLDDYLARRSRR